MVGVDQDEIPHIERLHREAVNLAGGIGDLAMRACTYHHLYEHSRGNHTFPLLAAHGALWARGYFRRGMQAGTLLKWQYTYSKRKRAEMFERLTTFADAFRDINRRVCVETYFIYHVTERRELRSAAEKLVPAALLDEMDRCHAAVREGRSLSDAERREVFKAFFLWEQDKIVEPAVEKAFRAFEWASIKALALRPTVRFSYLPSRLPLPFRDFANTSERIEKGLRAFDIGAGVGWENVESSLRDYGVMPTAFFESSRAHFSSLRQAIMVAELQHPGQS